MKRKLREPKSNDFKKIIVIFSTIFVLSVFIGSFIYVDTSLRPTITVLAETKALELANRSINKAVGEIVKDKISYSDLMNTKLDSDGKITMIQANTIMMNKIASDVALQIQDELKQVKTTTSYIPIGTALGSPILAKYGPQLKVSIEPIGTVSVDFKTNFESSGINQSRHSIYLQAKTQVKVVIPLTTTTKEVKAQIPICETIIVGDVPNSYVNIPDNGVINTIPKVDVNNTKSK
ncbi:sporulation protein YunB [Romboutsia lituseburensis]|uniref:Sporulation protein YunB n=1 Tax=Romboutsia lituseburensis DSM 797 TaxID=1121325 RepID=A0A1G9R829_9FIRM|nr:sporulation protein YunB [Romboutsia lituseburensis]CEH35686.1 Sporulation protein YunB [Romboutsia lituseburensis]SDM19384.1 sporulation protein YunB [Romboutsia lituseburensis DSM 797]